MAAVANMAARERSAVLSERNGTMLNRISNSPSLIIPVKVLWHRRSTASPTGSKSGAHRLNSH
jgi:hypothetical protein